MIHFVLHLVPVWIIISTIIVTGVYHHDWSELVIIHRN